MQQRRHWSPTTEVILREAGWYPGRKVTSKVERWRATVSRVGMSQAAENALTEFGDLRASADGPGIECAQGSFYLNPEFADEIDEEERAQYRHSVIGELFPLGERDGGHGSLFVDDAGRVYFLFDELELMGDCIEDALDAILVGRLPKKLAPPRTS